MDPAAVVLPHQTLALRMLGILKISHRLAIAVAAPLILLSAGGIRSVGEMERAQRDGEAPPRCGDGRVQGRALLASQSAKATDEISTQIAGMQAATQDSVAAIKEIGGTISRISEIAATIAAAVEEQGAATQEIARNVGEAAKGTQQVASNITDVNRGAGETGSASAQVLASAQSLSSESNHLKAEVDKFFMTVGAA